MVVFLISTPYPGQEFFWSFFSLNGTFYTNVFLSDLSILKCPNDKNIVKQESN